MIFASEPARNLFHALPTDTQLQYSRLSEHAAQSGRVLEVLGVMKDELTSRLEVIVRISEKLDLSPSHTD